MSLLLVEDDSRVSDFLVRGLHAEGYGVTLAVSGSEGLNFGLTGEFDLILLDLVLPGMPGLEVCQELRARRMLTPILMLTALDTVEDKVEGLRIGADDYLTKPFDFDELLAHIQVLIRRSHRFAVKSEQLTVADLVFDRQTLRVQRGERVIELTAKELALLELLMSVPGKVFSRTRILNNVRGYAKDPLTNVVDVYIRRLRNKIDEGAAKPLIKTVRGMGYKLDAT